MTNLIIETENLTCEFNNNVLALDKLSIQVPSGIIFGFLGSNGSGKTTVIHLLLGLLKPYSGSARVLGFDTQSQATEIRSQTGALLEHTGLYERLSAQDNLEFYGRIYRLKSKERRDRIKELLSHMGLWERRHEKVGSWSRGMKQKLAVARTLLHRPPLVFLDEPTAGLDPEAALVLGETLTELVTREGITVFLTTHNLTEAEKLCAKVGIIQQGKLLLTGHPNELRANMGKQQVEVIGRGFDRQIQKLLENEPTVTEVQMQNNRLLISLHSDAQVSQLVNLLVKAGCEIEYVHKNQASLEEVFLNLIRSEQQIINERSPSLDN
jgi:ABC-2 type transport system ATP-binding protein